MSVLSRVHLPVVQSQLPKDWPAPAGDPLVDGFSRRIRYLRISVTDRCNYRCSYCMPETLAKDPEAGIQFQPKSAVLTFEELEVITTEFARLGVRKLRLTGGEPTVRHGIVDLVRRLAAVPGIEQVVMTTNGHLLADLAVPLREAGLSAVNVSLDTLDPARFRRVTGRGELERVLAGIDAARAAGLKVKTNAVALADINGDEIVALCEDAWRRGAVPRFIEHMPMSDGALFDAGQRVSAARIRRTIEDALGPLHPAGSGSLATVRDGGPARYWALADGREVGIISAMTEHFCDDCNRLRLTATGDLHACLGHDDAVSLRDVLRSGGPASPASPGFAGALHTVEGSAKVNERLVRAIAGAVSGKRAGHELASNPPAKHMIGIGG